MSTLTSTIIILTHVLIGSYFVFYAFWNIYHWGPILKTMADRGIPHPYLILPLGILIQAIAGYLIMFGLYVHLAAIVLIPFTLITVVIFHPFWKFQGEARILNFSIFLVNVTVTIAALLLLLITSIW